MESKSDKFHRLAEARTNRAINAISSIGKLSNRIHYDFEERDVKAIFGALKDALEDTRSKFELSIKAASKKKFQLKDGE
jgi:hypothetical protein